jgi:hypothetical protein
VRFLELYRLNTVFLARAGVASVRVVIVSLCLGIACIVLTIAGSVFSLEAPAGDDFSQFHHFVWFAVTTVTTVGFGDFSPSSTAARTCCMGGMILAVSWIPLQISRLQSALSAEAEARGSPPDRSEPFVLLCGELNSLQLLGFFRQIEAHRIAWPRRFVVLTPTPLVRLELHKLPRELLQRVYAETVDLLRAGALGHGGAQLMMLRDQQARVPAAGEVLQALRHRVHARARREVLAFQPAERPK